MITGATLTAWTGDDDTQAGDNVRHWDNNCLRLRLSVDC